MSSFYAARCIICSAKINNHVDVIVVSCALTYDPYTRVRRNRPIETISFKRSGSKEPRGFIHIKCWERLIRVEPEALGITKVKKQVERRIRLRGKKENEVDATS